MPLSSSSSSSLVVPHRILRFFIVKNANTIAKLAINKPITPCNIQQMEVVKVKYNSTIPHCVRSSLGPCPVSQVVQEEAPVVELTLPFSQTSHVVMSADLYFPG